LRSLDVHHAYHRCDLENPPNEDSDTAAECWRSPILDADTGPKSTNLKTLRFYLSESDPEALTKILSFPRGVEHFTLTHMNYLDFRQHEVPREPELIVEALRQQESSLTSLDLQGIKASSVGIRLESFTRLRALAADFDALFGGIRREYDTRILSQGPKDSPDLKTFLPPGLESLTLRYRIATDGLEMIFTNFELLGRVVVGQASFLPMLQKLCLVEEKFEGDTLVPGV
jgi:hypothetical protein